MAATTTKRAVAPRTRGYAEFPVAAATKILGGTLFGINASGYAVPVTEATGLVIPGRAESEADNTGGAAGAVKVLVKLPFERIECLWVNDGAAPVTQAHVLRDCYGLDNQTVSSSHATNTRSVAGKVAEVTSEGVWVYHPM